MSLPDIADDRVPPCTLDTRAIKSQKLHAPFGLLYWMVYKRCRLMLRMSLSLQLYELSDDPKRKEFLDDLFTFMQKKGESILSPLSTWVSLIAASLRRQLTSL